MAMDVSALPKETVVALVLHFQSLDDARLVTNNVLIERLNNAPGDAHAIFDEWSRLQNDLSERSKEEIARIVCGGGPREGEKGN